MRKWIPWSLLFMGLLTSCAIKPNGGGQDKSNDDLKLNLEVEKRVLDNGLTVLMVKNDHLPIFSYYSFYKVGARFEDKGISGASHFLEHLMFKGAKKYGPGKFDQLIESNGGSSNAYTSMDLTVYHENLPIGALETIIDLEADRMENLLLDPVAFEKERKVILEERKYRYENSPAGQLFLALNQHMYQGTPYGGSVIGSIEDLKSVSRDAIFQYFKKFYAPNNAILVVVGKIDVEQTFSLIKKKYGHLPRSQDLESIKSMKDQADSYSFKVKEGGEILLHGNAPSALFTLSYPGEPAGKYRSYVMDLLASVLGDGQSSYLVQEYVQSKNPLVNNVYASNYNLHKSGLFMIGGEMLGEKDPNLFFKDFLKRGKKICQQAIDDRSIQKAKNQYFISYLDELQTNAGIAEFIGLQEAIYGQHDHYKKELEIYQAITTEEVKKVCHELLGKVRPSFLAIWVQYPQAQKWNENGDGMVTKKQQ